MAKSLTPKMEQKIKTVAKMILTLRPLYQTCTTDTERGVILNSLGAAIFYIGSIDTGLQSSKVTPASLTVNDHKYSRKQSALTLLTSTWLEDELISKIPEFLQVNRILKEEHTVLTRIQKEYPGQSPEQQYTTAGICLLVEGTR